MFANFYSQMHHDRQHRQELLHGVERDRLAQIALEARSRKRRWPRVSLRTLRATARAGQSPTAKAAPDLCCSAAACC